MGLLTMMLEEWQYLRQRMMMQPSLYKSMILVSGLITLLMYKWDAL